EDLLPLAGAGCGLASLFDASSKSTSMFAPALVLQVCRWDRNLICSHMSRKDDAMSKIVQATSTRLRPLVFAR
ncbi:hypothetical protein LXJ56_28625, partial [Escherichia coli]|nr:hypothetical protein [Escherichia coli]